MAESKTPAERLRMLSDDYQAAITRLSESEREALRAGADALDHLAQTCGNCQHAQTEGAWMGEVICWPPFDAGEATTPVGASAHPFTGRNMPLDERCKGWTAKEPEA
ncbi:MAG: hypothetical protein IT348_05770 [Candidatus Eisenbacteria bacterium]|nr:hypothetical protein [Candidatus Eisenbacteria bacterium]